MATTQSNIGATDDFFTVTCVNRKEATNLIQEIQAECKNIRGTSIMLMEPSESNLLSKGFQVKIKMKATQSNLQCLRIIAQQYGYEVHVGDDNWSVTILRPFSGKESNAVETGLM